MAQLWNFKMKPDDIPGESGEKSCFDYFKTRPHRHLVRELIQNSMDVPAEKASVKEPVSVSVEQLEIPVSDFPALITDLIPRLEACSRACMENANGRDPYKSKVEYLKNIGFSLPCLRVSDFHTTGMDYSTEIGKQSKFKAGVRLMGASHKSNGRAGGSYGMGKTVGFVASQINAVYYSTMTEDGDCYAEGIVRLCEHIINNVEYSGDAFYDGKEGRQPDCGTEIPELFRRTKSGTDVNVLGYTPTETEKMEMKQEILRSFWRAIMDEELVVTMFGETFNAETLPGLMEKYFEGTAYEYDVKGSNSLIKRYNPKPYYKHCVKSEEDEQHFLFQANSEEYPTLGSAKLYIYKDASIIDNTDDRIVCMRDKKMAIEVRKPNTRKGFYGVFICDGAGSETLRFMENVTHDKWDINKAKELGADIQNKAALIDAEINRFITESVKQIFPESENQEYSIPAMNQFLIGRGTSTTNNGASSTGKQGDDDVQQAITTIASGIKQNRVSAQKIGRLVIRRKGGSKKKKKRKDTPEEMFTPIDQPVNPQTPPTDNPTHEPTVKPDDPNTNPSTGGSVKDPNNPSEGQIGKLSPQGTHSKKKSGRHAEDIEAAFRVVPIMDDYGLTHRIIINSDDNYTSCSMVVMVSGEEKDSSLEFHPLDSNLKLTGAHRNIVSGFNLVKGKNIIDIKFIDEDYHSLTIKAYEN